jgi:hypothetical protein
MKTPLVLMASKFSFAFHYLESPVPTGMLQEAFSGGRLWNLRSFVSGHVYFECLRNFLPIASSKKARRCSPGLSHFIIFFFIPAVG